MNPYVLCLILLLFLCHHLYADGHVFGQPVTVVPTSYSVFVVMAVMVVLPYSNNLHPCLILCLQRTHMNQYHRGVLITISSVSHGS